MLSSISMNQTTNHATAATAALPGSSSAADTVLYDSNHNTTTYPTTTHMGHPPSLSSMNSYTAQHYPQHQQNFVVSPTPSGIFHNGMTTSAPTMLIETATTNQKRTREVSTTEGGGAPIPIVPVVEQPPSLAKRTRNNYHIPSRQIPRSYASQVGSLVVPKDTSAHNLNATATTSHHHHHHQRIGFRRQLSSSKIEALLSSADHDSMDLDPEATRPRSMSF